MDYSSMLPLLILCLIGGLAEGQQIRRARQGFRPRGFVPQGTVRYVPGHHGQDPHQTSSRGPRQEPEPPRHTNTWSEEPQIPNTHIKREKPWEDESTEKSRINMDEEQWQQETVQDRKPYQYPSFHPKPQSFNKPFTTPIPIIRLDKEQSLDGSYKSSYETGNSIVHEETGFMKQMEGPEEMLVQQGSYSYADEEGNVFTVRYTADDQGFRAHGDHFPTPPPIPPEIQRGLEIIYEQIRLDAERRLLENKFDNEEGNSLDHSGQYTTNQENRSSYRRPSQEQRESRFRNNVVKNETPQHYSRSRLQDSGYRRVSSTQKESRSAVDTTSSYHSDNLPNHGEVQDYQTQHTANYNKK